MSTTSTKRRVLSKSDYKVAAQIFKRLTDRYNEYLDDCEADRKLGYRPHYCEHGTNQHTDWDNICGPCEDGYSMREPLERRKEALRQAREYHEEMMVFVNLFTEFMAAGRKSHALDNEDCDALWKMIKKNLNALSERYGVTSPFLAG